MRLVLPNPLGAPISLDSSHRFPHLALNRLSSRRSQLRLFLLAFLALALINYRPCPPFPPSYRHEYRVERSLPQLARGAVYPEGRAGRYLK